MKIIALALLFAMTIGVVIAVSVKTQRTSEPQEIGTLKWFAQQAREKGEKEALIPAPNIDYAGSGNNMDELLSYFDVLIAQPIEERVYVHGSDSILTWYKLRIVETLTQQKKRSPCSPCLSSIDPPNEMLPLNADEFLVARIGGTVLVDGVMVTMQEPNYPPFSMSHNYLFFLSIEPSGVAKVGAGPIGIFTVDDNGIIEPINKKPHPIKQGLQNRFGNSVNRLKAHLKSMSL